MPLWFPSRSLPSRTHYYCASVMNIEKGVIWRQHNCSICCKCYGQHVYIDNYEWVGGDSYRRTDTMVRCSIFLAQCIRMSRMTPTATSALKSSNGLVIVMKTVYCEVGTGFFFLYLGESPGLVRARALPLQICGRRSVTERGRSRSTVGWPCQFNPPMPSLHPERNS